MNSLNKNINGKLIRLKDKYASEELNDKKSVYLVDGGFGSSSFTMGTALFIKCTEGKNKGKTYRISGMDKIELVKG